MALPFLSPRTRRAKAYSASNWPQSRRDKFNDRQSKVEGFSLHAYQHAEIGLIGLGGLGTPVAHGLVRNGARHLDLFDDDIVEDTNLSRQHFHPNDVGTYKVHAAAKHLIKSALFPLTVTGFPFRFQEAFTKDETETYSLLICGVDNNPTRRAVAAFAYVNAIPVIFSAVARDASSVSVFVQEPGGACWSCAHPQYLNDTSYPCQLPAIIDATTVTAGLVLYAASTVICHRPRHYNNRHVYLDGGLPDSTTFIERRPDCPICGDQAQVAISPEINTPDAA